MVPDELRIGHQWLRGALWGGLALGVTQTLRGAHFSSHTLWTALVCWGVAGKSPDFQVGVLRLKVSGGRTDRRACR